MLSSLYCYHCHLLISRLCISRVVLPSLVLDDNLIYFDCDYLHLPFRSRTPTMLLAEALPLIKAHWPIATFVLLVAHLLHNKFYKGLNKYPGHPLAAYTNWWRFWDVSKERTEYTHIALHKQHGDIVRLGPNVLSFADPKAIKTIYGLNKGMTKVRLHLIMTYLPAYHTNTTIYSLPFIQSNKLLLRASVYSPSSAHASRTTTQNIAVVSTAPLPCHRWLAMSHS